jgi:hypothetical protein
MTADMVQQLQLGDDARGFAQDTQDRLDVNAATVSDGGCRMARPGDACAAAAGVAGEIGTVVT